MPTIHDHQTDDRCLIFGGTGSLGKKLIERFIPNRTVAVYSRDEAKHWTIKNELASGPLEKYHGNLNFFVGDVRDPHRIKDVLRRFKPQTVIIAAALKQVDTCELSPNESILTNLIGTQNIIDCVNDHVSSFHLSSEKCSSTFKVLFVSTDKACSPINVYGMCKAISEKIVTSQSCIGLQEIKYVAVRYGNVLESRGSIIPLFKYQADNASFLTVTDPNMTRFVMTLDDSVDLISNALKFGRSGQTWLPKLPAMKIGDLAEIFADRSGKPIKIIGLRPGEKTHEDLINESESIRTNLTPDNKHYVIESSFDSDGKHSFNKDYSKPFTYTSANDVMSKDQLFKHLSNLNIIDKPLIEFKGISIEEIITNRKE